MAYEIYTPVKIQLTPEQIDMAKQAFDYFDKSGDGYLSFDEASLFMLTYNIDQIFIPIAFEICDFNNDDMISFEEFKSLFNLLADLEDNPSIIYKNMFNRFDINNNGFLDHDESEKFFRFIFKNFNDKIIKFYIDYFDKNRDGKLDFEEITKILDILIEKRF